MAAQQNKYVKGIKTAAEIIGAVGTVIGAAGTLKDTVQPALESEEGKAVVEKAKGKVGGIAGKVVGVKDSFVDARKAKKEEKDLAKALKEGQQTVLVSASRSVPVKEYLKLRQENDAAAAIVAAGFYNAPGCFAIATYSKLDFDKDLTDYLGVYVGSGENVGKAIDLACSRFGNADVYADIKYDQNVHLYVYPCTAEELEVKEAALAGLLQAELSYNALEDTIEE